MSKTDYKKGYKNGLYDGYRKAIKDLTKSNQLIVKSNKVDLGSGRKEK